MLKIAKWSALVIGILLLPVGYIVSYEALSVVLPPIIYIAGGMVAIILVFGGVGTVIFGYELVKTRVAQLGSQRIEFAAEAKKKMIEADHAKIMVITAKHGDQLAVRDNDPNSEYRLLHLPWTRVNGTVGTPTLTEMDAYHSYNGRSRGHVASETLMLEAPQEPDTDILDDYGSEWIESMLLPSPHTHYCGATRSGKTTLANHHIEWIKRQNPDAKFYLINPKDTAARKPFIIPANYKDIDEAMDGLEFFNQLMIRRKNDPELTKDAHKIVFVIDEWDWIFRVYKWDAIGLLEPLVKVGAELNIQVILIGQSPLSGDTGLSQSLYYNMVRIAVLQEGVRLIKNYSLSKNDRDALLNEYNNLRGLSTKFERQTGQKLRYCTVVPMAANPTIQVIPFLADPEQIQISPPPPLKPTEAEREILVAWWHMRNDQDFSGTKLHLKVSGLTSRPNAKQLEKYRVLLRKFGQNPNF